MILRNLNCLKSPNIKLGKRKNEKLSHCNISKGKKQKKQNTNEI